jgi:hypothetical protein
MMKKQEKKKQSERIIENQGKIDIMPHHTVSPPQETEVY